MRSREDMQREFVENNGEKTRRFAGKKRNARRPQRETYEHELAEAFTDGIKVAEISRQLEIFGQAHCVRCNNPLSDRIEIPVQAATDYYIAALAQAMTNSAKHHTLGRGGHGYRPDRYGNDFGHDTPFLIETPICHPCHTGPDSKIHLGVQFTKPVPATGAA